MFVVTLTQVRIYYAFIHKNDQGSEQSPYVEGPRREQKDAPGPSRINFSEVQFNCNIETFFGDDVKLS